jgi:hypothetical protein
MSGGGRRFGLTVGSAFLALAALATWRGRPLVRLITGTLGTALVFSALVIPQWLGPVERAWSALAHALAKVTTPLVLGVVYLIVITPGALLLRVCGRRPLTARRAGQTFWVARAVPSSDLHRQF